jgi:hypothetical protein
MSIVTITMIIFREPDAPYHQLDIQFETMLACVPQPAQHRYLNDVLSALTDEIGGNSLTFLSSRKHGITQEKKILTRLCKRLRSMWE